MSICTSKPQWVDLKMIRWILFPQFIRRCLHSESHPFLNSAKLRVAVKSQMLSCQPQHHSLPSLRRHAYDMTTVAWGLLPNNLADKHSLPVNTARSIRNGLEALQHLPRRPRGNSEEAFSTHTRFSCLSTSSAGDMYLGAVAAGASDSQSMRVLVYDSNGQWAESLLWHMCAYCLILSRCAVRTHLGAWLYREDYSSCPTSCRCLGSWHGSVLESVQIRYNILFISLSPVLMDSLFLL